MGVSTRRILFRPPCKLDRLGTPAEVQNGVRLYRTPEQTGPVDRL